MSRPFMVPDWIKEQPVIRNSVGRSAIEVPCKICGKGVAVTIKRLKINGNIHYKCKTAVSEVHPEWISERRKLLTPLNLGWLAGILEGEAAFVALPARIALEMTDLDIMERAAVLVGATAVQFTSRQRAPNRKPLYRFQLNGDKALFIMIQIWPLMGIRRKERIDEAIFFHYFEREKPLVNLNELGLV